MLEYAPLPCIVRRGIYKNKIVWLKDFRAIPQKTKCGHCTKFCEINYQTYVHTTFCHVRGLTWNWTSNGSIYYILYLQILRFYLSYTADIYCRYNLTLMGHELVVDLQQQHQNLLEWNSNQVQWQFLWWNFLIPQGMYRLVIEMMIRFGSFMLLMLQTISTICKCGAPFSHNIKESYHSLIMYRPKHK